MSIKSSFQASAKATWKYYLWPTSFKKFVGAVLLQQALHFGIGSLIYPNIEDFLIDGGFDEETASELSTWIPNIITPLPQDRSIGDHLFSLTEMPTLPLILFNAYSNMFYSLGHATTLGACSISAESFNAFSASEKLDAYVGVGGELISDIPNLNQLVFNHITLHEQGHCSPKLLQLHDLIYILLASEERYRAYEMREELNSDLESLQSLEMASANINQGDVESFILYYRAISRTHLIFSDRDFEHDIALQLYAAINRIELPTTDEILQSREEISILVRKSRASRGLQTRSDSEWRDYIPNYESWTPEGTRVVDFYVDIIQEILEENDLGFWAQKRAELYLEAVQYFVPSVEVTYSPKVTSAPNPPALP